MNKEKRKHHPWRRFFARTIDEILFIFFYGYILVIVDASFPETTRSIVKTFGTPSINISFAIISLFIFVFIESSFVSTIGTTPAKWLFGIRISYENNKKLSFNDSLGRSSCAIFKGEGLFFPIIIFFTRYFAYRRLMKTSTTLWDKSVNSIVSYKEWGVIRFISCTVTALAFLAVIGTFNSVITDTANGTNKASNNVSYTDARPLQVPAQHENIPQLKKDSFDLEAARKAGVPDSEIIKVLADKHGYDYLKAYDAGIDEQDMLDVLLERERQSHHRQAEIARLEAPVEKGGLGHSDWVQVVQSEEFQDWLKRQPPGVQVLTKSSNADDAGFLVSEFKQYLSEKK